MSYDRLSLDYRAFSLFLATETIPTSSVEALLLPHWRAAMEEEITALVRQGTWDLVSRPADANVVSCRWVFTIKYNPDRTCNRYKARLVARGFSQAQGIDYEETFSPVVHLNSIRILLSMAVNYVWPLHQLDVSNAFLYGDLTECVYMEKPPGYSVEGENDKVCLLPCALYGLKHSPRAWFEKFSALVSDRGLMACNVEPTVFLENHLCWLCYSSYLRR